MRTQKISLRITAVFAAAMLSGIIPLKSRANDCLAGSDALCGVTQVAYSDDVTVISSPQGYRVSESDDPDTPLCIGKSERSFTIDRDGAGISGMAFTENGPDNILSLLDRNTKQILRYTVANDNLVFKDVIQLRGARFTSPRGLAYSREGQSDIYYFVDYANTGKKVISRLYRYDNSKNDLTFVDLTNEAYDIDTREVFGVTKQNDALFVSFDPSDYTDQVVRIRRGIIKISVGDKDDPSFMVRKSGISRPVDWAKALAGQPVVIKHLPGPGKSRGENRVESSLALAAMTFGGADYIWGTVGTDNIYLIDGETGRGIFFFDMPGWLEPEKVFHSGMAFGAGHLWVVEPRNEKAVIHRVNVLDNLDMPYEGPKRFRKVRMRLTSVVRDNVETPRGLIYHTFLHPFPEEVLGRQGVFPNTVQANDLTNLPDCRIEHLSIYPGNDPASRQDYTLATYSADEHPDIRKYETDFTITVWTREYKNFIYPHLVKGNSGPAGTSYLEDDDILFKYNEDPEIYKSFMQRVKDYSKSEYGIEPDMDNPYWAARNITEYVKENYHYPKDEEGFYATYDFGKGNFNSNPGNLKAELSADGDYTDNITACSGTGAMMCGALRFIGIPATWIGVSQEQGWEAWNTEDGDEFLEFNEESAVGNGHRYNHVWLGDFYKWQRFDATPTKPDGIEFDKKPREVSQWDIMLRSASGVEARRVIHTIQSEFWSNLHVAFANCEDQVNGCGATRYNLLGTYTYPEDFNTSRNTIRNSAIQFINDVNVMLDDISAADISWNPTGEWECDPDATVNVVLEKKSGEKGDVKYEKVRVIAHDIPVMKKKAGADLSGLDPGWYRIKVIKVGDPATGNADYFEIP